MRGYKSGSSFGDHAERDLQFFLEAAVIGIGAGVTYGWVVYESLKASDAVVNGSLIALKTMALSLAFVFVCLSCFFLSFRILLPAVRAWGHRLGALVMFLVFCACNYAVFLGESAYARMTESGFFLFLAQHPSVAQSVRFLLLMILFVPVFIAFVRRGERPVAKLVRFAAAGALVAAGLGADWYLSEVFRHVHPANRTERNHELVVMVPHLSHASLERVLLEPGLSRWSEQLNTVADVIPTSNAVLPQAVSFLTAKPAWVHGVRQDELDDSTREAVQQFLAQKTSAQPNPVSFLAAPGVNSVSSSLFARAPVCRTRGTETVAESLQLLLSQVPVRWVVSLFPEVACSQRSVPLHELVRQELRGFANLLNAPVDLRSVWWIAPVQHLSSNPEKDLTDWEKRLASVLRVMEDYLHAMGIAERTRVVLAGVSPGAPGVVAFSSPADGTIAELVREERLRPDWTQMSALVAGALPSSGASTYSESVLGRVNESGDTNPRALFFAQRSLWCRWETPTERNSLRVGFRPAETGIRVEIHEHLREVVMAPVSDSRAGCLGLIAQQFLQIIDNDAGFEGRRPLHLLALRSTGPLTAPPPAPTAVASPTPAGALPGKVPAAGVLTPTPGAAGAARASAGVPTPTVKAVATPTPTAVPGKQEQ